MATLNPENKGSVLLVDDDIFMLKAVSELLKDKYSVSCAKSGIEALELLGKPYTPDIVLLDIDMPGINGFEVLSLMREYENMQDVPVIFLTGIALPETETKGIASGAVDYIIKPFVKDAFLARLKQRLLNGRRLRQLSILEKERSAEPDAAKFEKLAAKLTETERKILRLITLGYSNREISDTLHYSVNYVKNVVSVIYEKNNVKCRTDMKKLLWETD